MSYFLNLKIQRKKALLAYIAGKTPHCIYLDAVGFAMDTWGFGNTKAREYVDDLVGAGRVVRDGAKLTIREEPDVSNQK